MENKKLERFERLAEKRMSKVLNDIRLVGNLAGSAYDYTQEHIDVIVDALKEAVENVENRFAEPGKGEKIVFAFGQDVESDEDTDEEPDDEEEGYDTVEHNDENG